MAINITTWHPDTCGCEIDYSWDDTVSQDQRVHTPVKITHCKDHQSLKSQSTQAAFDAIMKENQSKNMVLHHVLENFPEVVATTTNDEGTQTKKLKAGCQYNWSFDQNRNLQVEVVGLPQARKGDLSKILTTNSITAQVK